MLTAHVTVVLSLEGVVGARDEGLATGAVQDAALASAAEQHIHIPVVM